MGTTASNEKRGERNENETSRRLGNYADPDAVKAGHLGLIRIAELPDSDLESANAMHKVNPIPARELP